MRNWGGKGKEEEGKGGERDLEEGGGKGRNGKEGKAWEDWGDEGGRCDEVIVNHTHTHTHTHISGRRLIRGSQNLVS